MLQLLSGQLLSVMSAAGGISSARLQHHCGVNIPSLQSGLVYLFLAFHLMLLKKSPKVLSSEENSDEETLSLQNNGNPKEVVHYIPCTRVRLTMPWYYYLAISLADSQAQYFGFLAFHYTSLTSILLLGSISIPSAMVISKMILKRKYDHWHYVGVIVCLVGFMLAIYGDTEQSLMGSHSFSKKVFGDMLVLCGSVMVGLNDTLTETMVKNFDANEYLGMLGGFGVIITTVQGLLTSGHELTGLFTGESLTCSTPNVVLLLLYNSTILAAYYVFLCRFLVNHDAAYLEIALLTTNFYAALYAIFAEKIMPSRMYWLSLVIVIGGMLIYEAGTTTWENEQENDEKVNKELPEVSVRREPYGTVVKV